MATVYQRSSKLSVKAIFFDLDNTLIPTKQGDKKACDQEWTCKVYDHWGWSPCVLISNTMISSKLAPTFMIFFLLISWLVRNDYMSNSDAEDIVYTYLRIFRNCPHNPEVELHKWRLQLWSSALSGRYEHLKDSIYQQWLRLRFHYLALTSEIIDLLVHLRSSYLLILITNGTSSSQWEKVERLNLRTYFDGIFVSGDLPWEKPHPNIFFEACQFLGVEPRECIMIGDKIETDILGGIKAGLGATFFIHTSQPQSSSVETAKPDYILSSVIELPHFLPKRPLMRRPTLPHVLDFEDNNSNSSDGS